MGSGTRERGGATVDRRAPARSIPAAVVLTGLAAPILIIAFFFIRLLVEAKPAFDEFGYIISSSQ
jgi:hypothetical protein